MTTAFAFGLGVGTLNNSGNWLEVFFSAATALTVCGGCQMCQPVRQ